jgi:tripartite-type tricarboxylate transporter receptor subunit TctC
VFARHLISIVFASAVAIAAVAPPPAAAQPSGKAAPGYPARSVRVVVPFAAGGPTDLIARVVAQKMSESFGRQFYVENIPGAGSNIGTAVVARAPADGYTLLCAGSALVANPGLYAKLPYDPVRDFAPITLVAVSPETLVVNPAVPATTVDELVALVKASPGKYSFASPGMGTTPHLAGELFKRTFGLDLVHVPFNGAAPAITATIAGHTPIAFAALPATIVNVKEGTLRALAVLSEKRTPQLPDLPTMAEAGAPDHEADLPTSLLAPAGTPEEIVDLIYREVVKIVAMADVKDRLAALGFEPVANTPQDYAARMKREIAKWSKVARDANIKVE